MTLEGGINVQQGERRRDQPFRVGIADVSDEDDNRFWTNEQDDAVDMMVIVIRRVKRHYGKENQHYGKTNKDHSERFSG